MIKSKIDENQKNKIIDSFKEFQVLSKQNYLVFKAIKNDFQIQIYSNSKNQTYKLLIDGLDELINDFINRFNISIIDNKQTKYEEKANFIDYSPQIGSDEVGFGDFFGPVIVCASYFDENLKELLEKYNIKDSKKITDKHILQFVPKILNKINYSLLVVENDKLNSLISKKYNLNKIKSILHNSCLYNLKSKLKNNDLKIYIDQFTPESNYYNYLTNEKNIVKNITFKTKGEEKYPSIALSSCIARYTFLKKMDILSKKYNTNIPFGASNLVDEFAFEFKNKYGINELKKITKINFKNYKKLLS